jgi:hypothetical protein
MTKVIDLQGAFYPVYKKVNPTFSTNTFRCAEETVDELLKKSTTSDHPSMLLGKVQSGNRHSHGRDCHISAIASSIPT